MNEKQPFAGTRFLKSAAALRDLPAGDVPEVCFAGRSNAGKSSALNALTGQRTLARVSKTPGRTQLINFFDVMTADTLSSRLVDLPGYGFAQVPLPVKRDWGRLIEGYLQTRDCLRGMVLVMDVRHPLTDFDRQMLDWASACQLPCHLLLTKSDKLTRSAATRTLREVSASVVGDVTVQLFSATGRIGVEEAQDALTGLLAGKRPKKTR